MSAASIRRRLREFLFPDAVKVTTAELEPTALGEKFAHMVFNGITVHASARLDESIMSVDASLALHSILLAYREGRAQTAEERVLGHVLDHVARTFLRA